MLGWCSDPHSPETVQATAEYFNRCMRGDQLIRQEMQKLLELDAKHRPQKPLLTAEGRIRLKNSSTNEVTVGHLWSEIVERAPAYFSNLHLKLRNRIEYGKAVFGDFVRISRQLGQAPYARTAARLNIVNVHHFFCIYFSTTFRDFVFLIFSHILIRSGVHQIDPGHSGRQFRNSGRRSGNLFWSF